MLTVASVDSMSVITTDTVLAVHNPRWRFRSLFSRSRNETVSNEMDANRNAAHRPAPPAAAPPARFALNVEPVIFLANYSFGLLIPVTSLFLFYARCVELVQQNGDDWGVDPRNASAICMRLDNDSLLTDLVERDVSQWRIYTQLTSTAAICLSTPLFGAWADRSRRRAPFLVCAGGALVYGAVQCVAVALFHRLPNVFHLFVLSELLCGLMGGLPTLLGLSFAIVSDDARNDKAFTPQSVPLRIGIACALQAVGGLMGSSTASAIEMFEFATPADRQRGYLMVFLVALLLLLMAFVYSLVWVRDTYHEGIEDQAGSSSSADSGLGFRLISSMKGSLEVALIPRPGYLRFCLNFIVASVFVEVMLFDTQLTCLFLKHTPFNWSDSNFANFVLLRFVFLTAGMTVIPFVVRRCKCVGRELFMIMAGVMANAGICLVMALARNSEHIMWSLILVFPVGAVTPGFRVLLPKLVPQEQTARLYSLVSLVMVVGPLFSALAFNKLFQMTLDTWPGCIFFIQSVLCVLVVCGLCVVHVLLRPLWHSNFVMDDQQHLLPTEEYEEEDAVSENDILTGLATVMPDEADRSISVTAVNSDEDMST